MATKVFTFQARALDGLTNESGALTYVVRKGTTTPIIAYTDSGLTTPATNPQVANALGLVGPLYWNDSVEAEVTFRVKTNDAATVLLQVDYTGGAFSASYIQVGQLTKFNATYTADGAQTKVLTGKVVSSPYGLNVFFDGIIQPKDNYTVTTDGTDSTITWATSCQPTSGVTVYYEAAVLQALSPAVTDYAGVDISAASVTPTGGSADSLADHLAAKLTSSGGDGSAVVVDNGDNSHTLADWLAGQGTTSDTVARDDFFAADGARIHRLRDRVFIDAATDDVGNKSTGFSSWLSTEVANYFIRSASFGSVSSRGGIGGTFASRTSDKYNGVTIWAVGQTITAGQQRGFDAKIYTATTSGTTGSTPPTHTSSTASDGGVTWEFTDYTYHVTIGSGHVAYSDQDDGNGAWAGYFESVRGTAGGSVYGVEIVSKNRGSNVTSDPFNALPAGFTHNIQIVGGGDASYGGAPANPSTSGITFLNNGHTINGAIVVKSTALTDIGSGYSYFAKLPPKSLIAWYVSAGNVGASIEGEVTAANEAVTVEMRNRAIWFLGVGGIMGRIESGAAAGTAADEHLRMIGFAAGAGYAELRAGGTASNIKTLISGKGASGVELYGNGAVRLAAIDGIQIGSPTGGDKGAGTVNSASNIFQNGSPTPYKIASSHAQVALTGSTSETTLADITIPANAVGPTGTIHIRTLWSVTNTTANSKTALIRIGTTGGTAYMNLNLNGNQSAQFDHVIRNITASTQKGTSNALTFSIGAVNAPLTTSSVDTTADFHIYIRGLLANSTDVMNLEAYEVIIEYGA